MGMGTAMGITQSARGGPSTCVWGSGDLQQINRGVMNLASGMSCIL